MSEQTRDEKVKDANGVILWEGDEVRKKCAEYFVQVLNFDDVKESNVNVVYGFRMCVHIKWNGNLDSGSTAGSEW